jgi:hypothetical protein
MLAFAGGWTLLHLGLFTPIANRITGERQDLSDFAELEGSLGMLAGLLLLAGRWRPSARRSPTAGFW